MVEGSDEENEAAGPAAEAPADAEAADHAAADSKSPPAGGLGDRILDVWRNPAYRFVLLFMPYLAFVSIGYPYVVRNYNGVIQAFILATAQIEYWLFVPFSSQVAVDEKLVMFGGFAVKIIDECTGIYEMLIFAAAVLAFPTSWGKKGIGLLMGCPLIYVFNVLRIAMLIVVGRYWRDAFDFMHLYFWQATMIVMITSVWLLWITKVVRSDEESAPASA
jgi:exosortase H (IPTLxxWG-CTERM-specific)